MEFLEHDPGDGGLPPINLFEGYSLDLMTDYIHLLKGRQKWRHLFPDLHVGRPKTAAIVRWMVRFIAMRKASGETRPLNTTALSNLMIGEVLVAAEPDLDAIVLAGQINRVLAHFDHPDRDQLLQSGMIALNTQGALPDFAQAAEKIGVELEFADTDFARPKLNGIEHDSVDPVYNDIDRSFNARFQHASTIAEMKQIIAGRGLTIVASQHHGAKAAEATQYKAEAKEERAERIKSAESYQLLISNQRKKKTDEPG